jgi:hypothetical protein
MFPHSKGKMETHPRKYHGNPEFAAVLTFFQGWRMYPDMTKTRQHAVKICGIIICT